MDRERTLNVERRTAINALYNEDYTTHYIAKRLKIPLSTVGDAIKLAKQYKIKSSCLKTS